jgi:hypothetical protein
MPSTDNTIKIINAPTAPLKSAPADYLPREEEKGLKPEDQFGFAFFTKKPVEHLTAQIDELRGKIATVVTSLTQSVAQNAELDEVSVGLAVSIDGDIGIASAGAEASIELTFKVKH